MFWCAAMSLITRFLPEIAILRHFRRVEPDGFDARTRPRVESPNAVGGTSELTELC
jgi:hypothetical protein